MSQLRDDAYVLNPWNVPVPVKPGHFVPLRPDLAKFNVVTDLGAIGAFGARRATTPPDDLLYADFQTTPDYCVPGRLGAGRAGQYRGRYIKGVGRTQLAANWNERGDQLHATGHLAASCVVRELVVSWYMEAKGLADRINGCEGALLGPLDPALSDHRAYISRSSDEALPCDRVLQGITVKGSSFARLSNFTWLMNNMDLFTSRDGLVHFLFLFMRYLDPNAPLALSDITPTGIAAAFRAAVDRTIAHFRDFFRVGVVWRFPQNNVTMDGRFHDLDFPIFVGGPFLGHFVDAGVTRVSVPKTDPVRIFGLTVLAYLYQTRIFYKLLRARIALLPELDFSYSASEREFIHQLLAAFDEQLADDHPLRAAEPTAEILLRWMVEDCDITASARPEVERMVRAACRWRLTQTVDTSVEFELRDLDVAWARLGQIGRFKIASFACCGLDAERLDEARFMNSIVNELDAIGDRDGLLSALEGAEKRIKAGVAPAPFASSARHPGGDALGDGHDRSVDVRADERRENRSVDDT